MSEVAQVLVVDLETYPTRRPEKIAQITQEALAQRPKQNTKKEIKDRWDTMPSRQARVNEALDKTAVDPLWAEIVCVCWMDDASLFRYVSFMDDDLLEEIGDELDVQAGPETIWVGHNVMGFDLPVLLNNWRRHEIKPPEHFPQFVNGRWRGRIYDTMLRVPGKTPYVSLDEACFAYDILPEAVMWLGAPMDGSRMKEAVDAGEWEMIQQYCMCDVRNNRKLFDRMTCGNTWGTYTRDAELAEQVRAIESGPETEGQKALALVKLLDNAGRIPR